MLAKDETWMLGSSLDVDVDEGVDVDGPCDSRLVMPNGQMYCPHAQSMMQYGLGIVPCGLCTHLAECARKDL